MGYFANVSAHGDALLQSDNSTEPANSGHPGYHLRRREVVQKSIGGGCSLLLTSLSLVTEFLKISKILVTTKRPFIRTKIVQGNNRVDQPFVINLNSILPTVVKVNARE